MAFAIKAIKQHRERLKQRGIIKNGDPFIENMFMAFEHTAIKLALEHLNDRQTNAQLSS